MDIARGERRRGIKELRLDITSLNEGESLGLVMLMKLIKRAVRGMIAIRMAERRIISV